MKYFAGLLKWTEDSSYGLSTHTYWASAWCGARSSFPQLWGITLQWGSTGRGCACFIILSAFSCKITQIGSLGYTVVCRTWTTIPSCWLYFWDSHVGIKKDSHWGWRKILILSNISNWWKVGSWQTVGFSSTKPREKKKKSYADLARGSFSYSLLDEKTSETFLCLQKAISLFLAAATSGVEKSSCLLYVAGSSSRDFKDFKVPETGVLWQHHRHGQHTQ